MKPGDIQEYRPEIDGLRALAVLAVLGYHAFPATVTGGFVGVDVFFVISGFLITSIILRAVDQGTFSFLGFYARRARRIFPALIIILVLCYAAGWFEMWAGEFKRLGEHIVAAAGFASNVVLWKETGYFDAGSETKPLLHLWSLGIEEQYYLIWPLLVWGAARFRRSLPALMWLILAGSFALGIAMVHDRQAAAFYLPFPRFWELMIGSGLAYATLRGRIPGRSRWPDLQAIAGLAAIGAAIVLLDRTSAFPGWWALLPTAGTMLLIASGPGAWINRRVLSHPVLVGIGLISYPLYLWHWPILTFLRLDSSGPLSVATRLAALLASVLCAWLTYRFIELPIRALPARRVAPALCVGLGMIGLLGLGTALSTGIPWRYPNALAGIDRYSLASTEISEAWRRHRCMLEGDEKVFAEECVDREPAAAPLVVLWGDSHAAALYPWLRNTQQIRIAQFNLSRCPPMLGFVHANPRLVRAQCESVNRYVRGRLRELRPSLLVLTAYWEFYQPDSLRTTLEELGRLGIPRIVVVGSVPVLNGNPSRMVFQSYRQNSPHRIPERLALDNFLRARESDQAVAAIARTAGVEFVSLLDAMCDTTSCLVSNGHDLFYTNSDHLSPPGAEFVMRRAFSRLPGSGPRVAP